MHFCPRYKKTHPIQRKSTRKIPLSAKLQNATDYPLEPRVLSDDDDVDQTDVCRMLHTSPSACLPLQGLLGASKRTRRGRLSAAPSRLLLAARQCACLIWRHAMLCYDDSAAGFGKILRNDVALETARQWQSEWRQATADWWIWSAGLARLNSIKDFFS